MVLVLIDSRIRDIQSIVDSLTANAEYVIFDFFSDSISNLQNKITKQYESVAIIQHNYGLSEYRFLQDLNDAIISNLESIDPELTTWQQYIDFLLWLKNDRGVSYVDLMACDLWSNPGWRYMIEKARSKYGLYIRASIDITGSGGDFILESDNFNTIGVYFTSEILNYKYAFFISAFLGTAGYGANNYVPYTLPDSNLAIVSTRYRTLLGSVSSSTPTYTNVKQTVAANQNSVVLTNGSAYVIGSGGFSQSLPSGVVNQSDLSGGDVARLYSGEWNFVALKNNGTIVCWGSAVNGGADINITTISSIGVNDVRSQLTNVVSVVIYNQAFAALRSDGAVITWGANTRGGDQTTASSFLSSGITAIFPGSGSSLIALKNNGTTVQWGNNGNNPIYSTSFFASSIPIVDVLSNSQSILYVRINGNTLDLYSPTFLSLVYTLPVGVTILKKESFGYSNSNFFLLFSNNTLGYLANSTWTLHNNVTDFATSQGGGGVAYAMIQNGVVVTSGTASIGGSLTNATYGLKPGTNLNNPVRLVSTSASLGCIKADNTFVWWGAISSGGSNYYGATFPTDVSQNALYNAYNGLSIANVYPCADGYAVVKTNGSIVMLGGTSSNGFNNTTNFGTKDANTNVYFESTNSGFNALEIPYLPSVTPTLITDRLPKNVSYYVSNPDKMAYIGRRYSLYYGANLLSTFIPTLNTHTYDFSNVIVTIDGTYTMSLTIRDETTIAYTVDTFSIDVNIPYPCFLEGSKILRFNPELYQDEYVPVEKLRKGDLIATAESGYKAIHSIGCRTIPHPKSDSNPSNRLFKFREKGMFEPLYITGEHCTLHREVSQDKREQITEHMGDVYITEEFYRIPACMDDRAEPYDREDKQETIWHFALEHENVAHNYGVYANGLLVESCAIESLEIKSGMVLIE